MIFFLLLGDQFDNAHTFEFPERSDLCRQAAHLSAHMSLENSSSQTENIGAFKGKVFLKYPSKFSINCHQSFLQFLLVTRHKSSVIMSSNKNINASFHQVGGERICQFLSLLFGFLNSILGKNLLVTADLWYFQSFNRALLVVVLSACEPNLRQHIFLMFPALPRCESLYPLYQ